jgi:hypothetical protein
MKKNATFSYLSLYKHEQFASMKNASFTTSECLEINLNEIEKYLILLLLDKIKF